MMEEKYKRLNVTISNETNSKLESIIKNRKVQSLTKSTLVEIALIRFFEEEEGSIKNFVKGDD